MIIREILKIKFYQGDAKYRGGQYDGTGAIRLVILDPIRNAKSKFL